MRLAFVSTLLLTTFFAACGDDGNNAPPDGSLADAAPPVDALPPFDCETSPSTGTHKVFLQFEGVTLTHAEISDATQNRSSVIDEKVTATIPAWRPEDPEREAHIQAVVCSLRETLYPYDVEVVTTRPASGDYEMVVLGGRGTDLGIDQSPATTLNALATTPCARGPNAREVAWVAEFPTTQAFQLDLIDTANMVAYTLGINSRLNFSHSGRNCMCHPIFSDEFCDTRRTCEFQEASLIPEQGHVCGGSNIAENQIMKLRERYGARR